MSSFLYVSWNSRYWKDLHAYLPQWAGVTLGNLTYLGAMSIQTFFIALMTVTALLFKELYRRMDTFFSPGFSDSNAVPSDELDTWRRHHDFVCRLVEKISHCFGSVLLIILIYSFIVSAKYATLIYPADTAKRIEYIVILSHMYTRLMIVLLSAFRMQKHVKIESILPTNFTLKIMLKFQAGALIGLLRRAKSSCHPRMHLQVYKQFY